jgi:hypothetical protein
MSQNLSNAVINELRPDLLASAAMNPWAAFDSSSRQVMMGSHLSQALVIQGGSTRRCLTGAEREFAKYTFKVKFPCNAEVVKVIDRYPRTLGFSTIRENPESIVIYEDAETKQIDILSIPRYHCLHQHFGFSYSYKAPMQRLVPGATFAEGTILADSPAVDDQGNYKLGVETEVAFMSVPGIIEDGVIISRAYAQKLKSKGFEKRVGSWGKNLYPINLYGGENEYKPFPDIGQPIRDDGLLFCLREYDDLLAPVQMSPRALREPDYYRDHLIYAEPGAKVIDVQVRHAVTNGTPPTPMGMEAQAAKYYQAQLTFYDQLLETYKDLRKRRGEALKISPHFQAMLREGLDYKGDFGKNRPKQMYQRVELDDWRVEITFEYDVVPDVGFKLTDFHGGKGVVCQVWETEDMPVDAEGNRAECIMDGDSTIKRMNIGRMYEQYINATSRHVTNHVRALMSQLTAESINEAWEYLLGYYKIISPRMYDLITGPSYQEHPRHHLEEIVRDGVYLYMPTDNPIEAVQAIDQLSRDYPITIAPVTYRGRSGNVSITEESIIIGSLWIMLLEKTGGDWSGVGSAKLQHFGIPAKIARHDKHSSPGRAQPVRILGESEVRGWAATMGGDAVAELLEMSNNPALHKHVVGNILRAERPSAIQTVIDRNVIPRGGSRALVYVKHALETAGARFVDVPDDEPAIKIYPPHQEIAK